ncbi:helix-turn-helix transcriptional regulator [Nonomuraea sp. NPDC050643]|uniref:helix-turn-helix domain-containing protein n=1 Tax=Nonomuraea sp. NPDC050643 TaxID=3155660 RepID=UPI0033CC2C6E
MSEETFGQVLHRLRGDRTLEAVAKAAGIAPSYVHKLENGRGTPSRKVLLALEAATNAQGALIEAAEKDGKQSAHKVDFLPSTAKTSAVRTLDTNDAFGEDATERRRLLQLAASAGVGLGLDGEPVRQLLDLALNVERSTEDWQLACADHLHALRTRPAAQVVSDLAVDLYALRQQIHHVPGGDLPDLCRTVATLACIQANATTRLGDHGAAIRWWHTARHAADASRDAALNVLIRAEEASCGLYGQRSPATVLYLVERAETIPAPSLKLLTAKAKALSMLGRHDDAIRAVCELSNRAEEPGRDDRGFWTDADVYFTQSWVYSAAGKEDLAEAGRSDLMQSTSYWSTSENSPYRTNTRLHEAMGFVARGEVDRGLRCATEALGSLPAALRHVFVRETGRMVLQAVPLGQRDRPAVQDVRSLLAIEA